MTSERAESIRPQRAVLTAFAHVVDDQQVRVPIRGCHIEELRKRGRRSIGADERVVLHCASARSFRTRRDERVTQRFHLRLQRRDRRFITAKRCAMSASGWRCGHWPHIALSRESRTNEFVVCIECWLRRGKPIDISVEHREGRGDEHRVMNRCIVQSMFARRFNV